MRKRASDRRAGYATSVLIAVALLCLSFQSWALVSITDDDYIQVYFNMAGKYYQDPSIKGEFFDVIEYYLTTQDVNSNLFVKGSWSGKRIISILDEYGAPCDCPPGPCAKEGKTCCCQNKQYGCTLVGGSLVWQFSGGCAQSCCGAACCPVIPTTTSTTVGSTTTINQPIPDGASCTNDVGCTNYGNHWYCYIPAGKTSGNCRYTGSYYQCSDGTIIGQCSATTAGSICVENALSTGTQLATSLLC